MRSWVRILAELEFSLKLHFSALDISISQHHRLEITKIPLIDTYMTNKPQREKRYLITCAHNENSNQSAHPHCLICLICPHKYTLHPSRKHAYMILTPLKPHFYTVKLGFTGVYVIFLISAQNHRLWELVRTASVRRF